MGKEIYKAVANLPEELITPEIAAAAIEEGKIELLDYLPHRYLTGEVVVGIIEKNTDSYSWRGFNLSSLPEEIRTKEVCEFAVKKDDSNIEAVPSALRSAKMLEKILNTTKRNTRYLHLFPNEVWTQELALTGVRDVYLETITSYGPRGGYHGSTTKTDVKRVQILLSYVPNEIKTKEFYMSLFDLKIKREDIGILTPDRYKTKAYYLKVAATEFELVPKQFYDYDIFMVAIENKKISFDAPSYHSYYNKPTTEQQAVKENHKQLMEAVFAVMDDAMADKVIEADPDNFKRVPEQFQTPERLIAAIEKCDRNVVKVCRDTHPELFTLEVCQAYIRKNCELPKLPETIWKDSFVQYCLHHGTEFRWFEQLPKNLQTKEMVAAVLKNREWDVRHVRPELISPEQAVELYRSDRNYKEYIPKHYLQDFMDDTGLDEKFYGGEVSFAQLREDKKQYTYCRLGTTYISIHADSSYTTPNIITITRRSPRSFRPEVVFRQEVSTFHTTWLEKMIADFDPSFVKPTVSKMLKPYQANGYFSLKKVASEYGADIYANVLLGEQVYFSAMIDGDVIRYNSLEEVQDELKEFHTESIDIGIPVSSAGLQVAI